MELKTDDIIRMVNANHRRVVEQAEINRQREQELQGIIAKKQKKEKVKQSVIMIGIGFILGLAPTAKIISDGHNEIVSEFEDVTSEYGIKSYSSGYQINYGTTYVEFDEGIRGMIDVARENGMNDIEIAIGLNSIIPNNVTKDFIDTSLENRCNQCINKYTEKKLSGEYKNGR